MSDRREHESQQEEQHLESLFRDVEPRSKPPADIEQAVYAHVKSEWSKQRAAQKRKKIYPFALAASLAFLLLLTAVFQRHILTPDDQNFVASVEKMSGIVSVTGQQGSRILEPGMLPMQILYGQTLVTGDDSGVAVKSPTGEKSIRVDQKSELTFASPDQIELVAGQVYLDVPPAYSSDPIDRSEFRISTPFGYVRHIGTQFVVAVTGQDLQVKVREGSVAIDRDSETFVTAAGTKGVVDLTGTFTSAEIQTFGPEWHWIEKLAPDYRIENRSVVEFLDWVRNETGKPYQFDSEAAEIHARETRLHGSDIALEPLLALDIVLQTTGLAWRDEEGAIAISVMQ